MSVLEAGDLNTLLVQFEASEAVNTDKTLVEDASNILSTRSSLNGSLHVVTSKTNLDKDVKQTSNSKLLNSVTDEWSGPSSVRSSPTHQKIKDSLPKEIIEKIKGMFRIGFS